eukprot:gene19126-33922_t
MVQTWGESYAEVSAVIQGLSKDKASKSSAQHDKTTEGLLYSVLVDTEGARSAFALINTSVRDDYRHLVSCIEQLCGAKYETLVPKARRQLLWLVSELVRPSTRTIT